MHQSAALHGSLFLKRYAAPRGAGTILDIGSQDLNGSLRQFCPEGFSYVGLDFAAGKGVDVILTDPYRFPFEDDRFDYVVSSSCFEHSQMFWLTFAEAIRVLKPDGVLYINVPSNGPYHRYPTDNWRFYPDAGLALCEWGRRCGVDVQLIESFIGAPLNDHWADFVACFGKSPAALAINPGRMVFEAHGPTNIWFRKPEGGEPVFSPKLVARAAAAKA